MWQCVHFHRVTREREREREIRDESVNYNDHDSLRVALVGAALTWEVCNNDKCFGMRAGRAVRMSEKRRPSCTPAHNVVVVVVVAQSNPFPPISFIFPLLSRCVPFFRYFFFHVASRIFFFLFRLHDQGRPSESRPLCGRHRLSGNAKYGCQMSALT